MERLSWSPRENVHIPLSLYCKQWKCNNSFPPSFSSLCPYLVRNYPYQLYSIAFAFCKASPICWLVEWNLFLSNEICYETNCEVLRENRGGILKLWLLVSWFPTLSLPNPVGPMEESKNPLDTVWEHSGRCITWQAHQSSLSWKVFLCS